MASRYSTIAIKPKVHEDIKKLAKHSFQTVGGYIEKLIETYNLRGKTEIEKETMEKLLLEAIHI